MAIYVERAAGGVDRGRFHHREDAEGHIEQAHLAAELRWFELPDASLR